MKPIAILGCDYKITTSFMNKIVENTKAKIDQEHLILNIIIDNKLKEKNEEEIIDIIKKIEMIDSKYLVLTFNDERIEKIIENNLKISLLNKSFKDNDDELIKKIIEVGKDL